MPSDPVPLVTYITDSYWKAFWPEDEGAIYKGVPVSIYLGSDVAAALAAKDETIAALRTEVAHQELRLDHLDHAGATYRHNIERLSVELAAVRQQLADAQQTIARLTSELSEAKGWHAN